MENYKRTPNSIDKNKSLSFGEKSLLAYIHTYQNKVIGGKEVPSGKYCFDTQDTIANNLGTTRVTINRLVKSLTKKGLIYTVPKSEIDGKPQYKDRLAYIMINENNPPPTKVESKEVIQDEIIEEVVEEPKFTKKTESELINYVMENSEGMDVQTIEDFKTAIFEGRIICFWQIDAVLNEIIKDTTNIN